MQVPMVLVEHAGADNLFVQTKVEKVERYARLSESPAEGGHARWVINDGREGIFDAVVCPSSSRIRLI